MSAAREADDGFLAPRAGVDFIAHHALQAQAGQSVYEAMRGHFRCRWRLGADQCADGSAAAAVLLDHRAFHPRLGKGPAGYRFLFHLSHDLGDIDLYRSEPLDDFDVVFVPGRRHREAAQAALARQDRVVEVGWPKFDPLPLAPEQVALIERLRSLPDRPTVLYAPTWANTWEWRELIPWLAAMPCNLLVKNHILVDPGRPFPPGEEERYAECRRSIDAMEAAVRAMASTTRIVLPAGMNLCAVFPHADVLVTDSSSCALEFLPFGASIETGRTGAGGDPAHDLDAQASRLCSDVVHLQLPEMQARFPGPSDFLDRFAAAPRDPARDTAAVVAPRRPGTIGPGIARLIDAYMALFPQGARAPRPGLRERLAAWLRGPRASP